MTVIQIVFVFIFGSIVGSFLNVCIYRLPEEQSIVFPASSCRRCKTKLKFYENIPLASYIMLGGKCSSCGVKISFRYFFVELLTAVLAVLLFLYFKNYFLFGYYFLFTALLIVVFFIDLDHKIILDEVTYPFTAVGILGSLFMPELVLSNSHGIFFWGLKNVMLSNFLNSVAGAFLGMAFFFLIRFFGSMLLKQEAMGLGDVKFAMLIGAFLGWQKAFLSFFISFFLGAAAAIFLIIFYNKKGRDEVPFGTFMAAGALTAVFFGDIIIKIYINHLFLY
ncbi:MAG: prepilin peptidase [Armatimonadota bacterium]